MLISISYVLEIIDYKFYIYVTAYLTQITATNLPHTVTVICKIRENWDKNLPYDSSN